MSALSGKKDFIFLRQGARVFSYQWLKVFFLYREEDKNINLAWSLPKSYVTPAVLRNRFKRWGREALRQSLFRGKIFIVFLKKDKSFYKKMKKKDFDNVFKNFLENFGKKT